jgi:hypothetical protein
VKQVQWANSGHAILGDFERSTTDCAPCHTHEGFIERIATGAMTTAADIMDPSPQNCRTCHQIHTTYTSADFALTTTAPFDLWFSGNTVDFGEGTLCANCHQARIPSPAPVIDGSGTGVTITSAFYGLHHSPVANVLGGTGLIEIPGNTAYPGGPSSHGNTSVNADGCVTCHMAQAFGAQAGGHTLWMSYDYHGAEVDNIAGCLTCHSATLTDFEYAGVHDLVWADVDGNGVIDVGTDTGYLVQLKDLLITAGLLTASDGGVAGTFTDLEAAALVNYQALREDKSHGIHNPPYYLAILKNSIEALGGTPTP